MIKPYLSIITICKNNIDGLKKTVGSVKSQIYTDYEHIIVDGDSKDDTKDYLKKVCDDKYIVISEPDNGISDAFNKGIKLSHGQYLVFINAGDTFISEYTLYDICCHYKLVNEVEIFASKIGRKTMPLNIKEEEFGYYWNSALIPHQSSFIKRSLFDKLGYFDTNFQLRMDYDFFYRCVQKRVSYCYHPDIIINYAYGGACVQNPEWFNVEGAKVVNKYENALFSCKRKKWIELSNIKMDASTKYFAVPADVDIIVYISMLINRIKHRYGKNICLVIEDRYSFILDMYGITEYQVSESLLNPENCAMLSLCCKEPTEGELFVASPEYYNGLAYSKPNKKIRRFIDDLMKFLDLDNGIALLKPSIGPKMTSSFKSAIEERVSDDYVVIFTEVSTLFIRRILSDYLGRGIGHDGDLSKTIIVNELKNEIVIEGKETIQNVKLSDMVALATRCEKTLSGMTGVCMLLEPFVQNFTVLFLDDNNRGFYDLATRQLFNTNPNMRLINWSGRMEEKGIKRCAIYGAGAVGSYLKECYSEHGIVVDYMIDQDGDWYSYDIPVLSLQDELPKTELIVVGIVEGGRNLVDSIREQVGIETIYYSDLIKQEEL